MNEYIFLIDQDAAYQRLDIVTREDLDNIGKEPEKSKLIDVWGDRDG